MTTLALAACMLLPPAVDATPAFHFPDWKQHSESVGGWPEIVAIADVTGDGRDDVVLGSSMWDAHSGIPHAMSDKLFVHVQQADGTLAVPIILPHGGTTHAGGLLMQAGDLDRDGMDDLVVSHPEGVAIAIATGGGRFDVRQFPIRLARDFLPWVHTLELGDLDGDRNLDIVRQNDAGGTEILLGDGDGGIREERWIDAQAGLYPKVRIVDATDDGIVDLVMSSDLGVQVHAGRGGGEFAAPDAYPRPAMGYGGMAVLDVSRDGRNDVVVTTPANSPGAMLHVYQQDRDGALGYPAWDLASYEIPETLQATDLDHNGYDDLLVLHGGWMKLGYYLQARAGLAAERLVDLPYASSYSPAGLATGDLDGDGCTDAAVADYNHGLRILYGHNCFEPWVVSTDGPLDFDGDGASDILWRHGTSGHNLVWRSARSGTRIPMRRVTDPDWRIAGVGDFDGDGRSDVLWRHAKTGRNATWGGATRTSSVGVSRVGDVDWQVAGVGDLDGDGQDDIVWRHRITGANRIWDGGASDRARMMTSVRDTDWLVVSVADFDGNGRDDVFWRNRRDGRNAIWNGGAMADLRGASTVADVAWQVAGTGDFDGDGAADVLWRHAFDGRNEIWPRADRAAAIAVEPMADLSWKVAGVGDYTGDGRADILWRNRRTGANVAWGDGLPASPRVLAPAPNLHWGVAR